MPPKKVSFGGKPIPPTTIDEFVSQGKELPPAKDVKMKRLTIDIPEDLHRAIKTKAALEGLPMADMLREILQGLYGKS